MKGITFSLIAILATTAHAKVLPTVDSESVVQHLQKRQFNGVKNFFKGKQSGINGAKNGGPSNQNIPQSKQGRNTPPKPKNNPRLSKKKFTTKGKTPQPPSNNVPSSGGSAPSGGPAPSPPSSGGSGRSFKQELKDKVDQRQSRIGGNGGDTKRKAPQPPSNNVPSSGGSVPSGGSAPPPPSSGGSGKSFNQELKDKVKQRQSRIGGNGGNAKKTPPPVAPKPSLPPFAKSKQATPPGPPPSGPPSRPPSRSPPRPSGPPPPPPGPPSSPPPPSPGPPPPPPGPPPPSPGPSSPSPPPSNSRSALLSDIEKGTKLRKVGPPSPNPPSNPGPGNGNSLVDSLNSKIRHRRTKMSGDEQQDWSRKR
ncbi:hypothetical protein QVD99_008599 [Batrachochytrium dendrobatidis]|nr:hypothetical protein QVD99_008599 [Batrachochytrium dendrobatidis]